MTATIDTSTEAGSPEPPHDPSAQQPLAAGRPVMAIELLTAHPGNVRQDVSLDQDYLDSIAELGIVTPLRVTPDGAGGYRVIEGHRRLAAAQRLGITEVPYDLAAERAGDEAGQFLEMYAANHHRKGLTVLEEADALFAASASGASRTRIRKATGLGRDDVTAALRAARMTGFAREVAAAFRQAVTLEQLALLAEFEDDTAAVNRIMSDICNGRSGQHAAEAIRQERAEATEHERLLAQLTAGGYTIAGEYPPAALMLTALLHDGQDLTPEAHAGCPGRGVYLSRYSPQEPRHYCTDPAANGHAPRYASTPLPDLGSGSGDSTVTGHGPGGGPQEGPAPDPHRRLVIEGNRAWVAARNVRKRWLADSLLTRRSAPREAMPFVTAQLAVMPRALRDALTRAPGSQLFREITGGSIRADALAGWAAGRLPLALLAVIATAYEDRMDGDAGRATWRTDQRFTQCDRAEAGAYLRFLASVGYELSPVEQAVADQVPYTGQQPDGNLTSDDEDQADDQAMTCGAPEERRGDVL